MSGAKPKSKSKSSRSSPRLYDTDDLPKFMQPLKLTWGGHMERRRPKSEILLELKRLRSLPLHSDEDVEMRVEVQPTVMPVRTLEQLDALRLTRHRLEQLLHCVNFEQVVRNFFVRLNINGQDMPPEHRIAEIMNVEELSEGYYLGSLATNIVLQLRYEDLLEKHELTSISNMAFTRKEFQLWMDNCVCQAIELPTTELIARKKIELYNALNSEAKLSSMLHKSGLLPIRMPMRPVPRGCLLERMGGVYPWKLQPPPPPVAAEEPQLETAADGEAAAESKNPQLELEMHNEELIVHILESTKSSTEHETKQN